MTRKDISLTRTNGEDGEDGEETYEMVFTISKH